MLSPRAGWEWTFEVRDSLSAPGTFFFTWEVTGSHRLSELVLCQRRLGLPLIRDRRYSVFLLQGILAHILVCRVKNMVIGRIHAVLEPVPLSVRFSYTRSCKFNIGVLVTPKLTPATLFEPCWWCRRTSKWERRDWSTLHLAGTPGKWLTLS